MRSRLPPAERGASHLTVTVREGVEALLELSRTITPSLLMCRISASWMRPLQVEALLALEEDMRLEVLARLRERLCPRTLLCNVSVRAPVGGLRRLRRLGKSWTKSSGISRLLIHPYFQSG